MCAGLRKPSRVPISEGAPANSIAKAGWTLKICGLGGLPKNIGIFATTISLLWTVHPLQTAAVTYVVQRAESLAGLFYLLTLWSFTRGLESPQRRGWLWISVGTCAAGMGCKETVFSAPLAVLLYDRTFVAGSFRESWRRRWKIYLAMAATWGLLAHCILATGNRGGTAGLDVGISTLHYLQTQCCALLEYLRLAVWPSPLIFDYGTRVITSPWDCLMPGMILAILGAVTLAGIVRRTWWGFFGFWFFALLAPSSSFVVVATQTMALHRMYLPLAALLAVLVLAAYGRLGRRMVPLCAGLAVLCGYLTIRRNHDYRSEFLLWSDTVAKCPGNARALVNLGGILVQMRHFSEAVLFLEEGLALEPASPKALNNLGIALFSLDKNPEAVARFRQALTLDPSGEDRRVNLAIALIATGEPEEARRLLEAALQINPSDQRALTALDSLQKNR